MRIALVPGTWSTADPWWRDGLFLEALKARAHTVVSVPWDTELDVLPPYATWRRAAALFTDLATAFAPEVVIPHSHGGNVVALALSLGSLWVPHLITVVTPPRHDLFPVYEAARSHIGMWRHLYSDRDWWSRLGSLFDGAISLERAMPQADCNIYVPGLGHAAGAWFDPDLWTRRHWWKWLDASATA